MTHDAAGRRKRGIHLWRCGVIASVIGGAGFAERQMQRPLVWHNVSALGDGRVLSWCKHGAATALPSYRVNSPLNKADLYVPCKNVTFAGQRHSTATQPLQIVLRGLGAKPGGACSGCRDSAKTSREASRQACIKWRKHEHSRVTRQSQEHRVRGCPWQTGSNPRRPERSDVRNARFPTRRGSSGSFLRCAI